MKKLIFMTFVLFCLFPSAQAKSTVTSGYGESVSLHLDNPAYYLGETMWFSASVSDSGGSGTLSRVLYVDLLAPEGYVVESRHCKIERGRSHGSIKLNKSLLSGLYEIRAYTRHMATSSLATYYTQAVPVYDAGDGRGDRGRSILGRRRSLGSRPSVMLTPLASSTGTVGITYDSASLRPFAHVRLKLSGEPGTHVSLSVNDAASYIGGKAGAAAGFMASADNGRPLAVAAIEDQITVNGTVTSEKRKFLRAPKDVAQPGVVLAYALYGKADTVYGSVVTDSSGAFSIGLGNTPGGIMLLRYSKENYAKDLHISVDKWFAPRPRAFSAAETAILDGRAGTATVREPQNAGNTGLTHSCIHTTVTDEVEWAMAFGPDGVLDYSTMKGQSNAKFIMSVMRHWGYPIGHPTRVIGVAGEYPGDDSIPKAKWLADYQSFNINDYDEIIIRTDSAICEAYAYSDAATYAHPRTWWSPQRGSNDVYIRPYSNYAKPTVVICLVEKRGKDKTAYTMVGESDHAYTRVDGYSVDVPFATPDYSGGQPSTDNRRLLYWNPDIVLDANGEATVEFYNNSSCRSIVVSAEGMTPDGRVVVYK